MKVIIAALLLLSIGIGFSGALQAYLPAIIIACAIVAGWITFTTKGIDPGRWPKDDIRSGPPRSDD